jgi:RNA polymerase-binding transcription factor DksA
VTRESDNLDIASELQDKFNQRGILESQAEMAQQTDPDFDGVHCLDCDAGIPAGRITLGRMRCVDCQDVLERKSRSYR